MQKYTFGGWLILPLRLFLGVTFVYGGIQKLTDPQYFNQSAHRYIGKQIAAFATGSPLHGLLNIALAHAHLFGALVAYGEIAIGTAVLLGFLLRPAAFLGLLLNVVFFLSASWHVYPYFYGSDIVFIFCWLTLLLAGPLYSGLPTLDGALVPPLLLRLSASQRSILARALFIITGVGVNKVDMYQQAAQQQEKQAQGNQRANNRSKYVMQQQRAERRRNFIWGIVAGGAGVFVLVWLIVTLHIFS